MAARRRNLAITNRGVIRRLDKYTVIFTLVLIILMMVVAYDLWRSDRYLHQDEKSKQAVFDIIEKERKPGQDFHYYHVDDYYAASKSKWISHECKTNTALILMTIFLLGKKQLSQIMDFFSESVSCLWRREGFWRHVVFLFLLIATCILAYCLSGCLFHLLLRFSRTLLEQHKVEISKALYEPTDYSRFQTKIYSTEPYYRTNVYRRLHEDVIFNCRLGFKSENSSVAYLIAKAIQWYKNGNKVETNERTYINTTIRTHRQGSFMYVIMSRLTIELIDKDDFDTYKCLYPDPLSVPVHVVFLYGGVSLGDGEDFFDRVLTHNFRKKKEKQHEFLKWNTVGAFRLYKDKQKAQPARIPVGALLIDHVIYWSVAKPGDVTLKESMWGKDTWECCSYRARLYWLLFGYRESELVWLEKGKHHRYIRYLVRQHCVCKEHFYTRNYTFLRSRYNKTLKGRQVIKVNFPQNHFFIPEPPYRCDADGEDETVWASKEYRDCADSKSHYDSIVCRQRQNSIDQNISLTMFHEFYLVVLRIFILLYILTLCYLFRRGFLHWLVIPVRNACLGFGQTRPDFEFEIYLTYDEEERYETKLAQNLKHELVENLGFRVFDVHRNILPGQHAVFSRESAIETSRRFLIIASSKFREEGMARMEISGIGEVAHERQAKGSVHCGTWPVFVLETQLSGVRAIFGKQCQFVSLSKDLRKNYEIDRADIDIILTWAKQNSPRKWPQIYGFLKLLAILAYCSIVWYYFNLCERLDVFKVYRDIYFEPDPLLEY